MVAVSGGKDSAASLGTMKALVDRGDLDVKLLPVHVDVGIKGFSEAGKESAVKLSRYLGLDIVVIDVREALGLTVEELAKKVRRPICSVCGLIKRYFLNLTALEVGADGVLLGHHLDDLFAYALKSVLIGDGKQLSKLGPKTESSGVAVGRGRPLYLITEREALAYAIIRRLPFLKIRCPHVRRESLETQIKAFALTLDEKYPGLRISYMKRLANAALESEDRITVASPQRCKYCGMPSSGEVCSVCSLTAKALGTPKGPDAVKYVRNLLASKGLRETRE
ncbi:MAG: adenine nucleotide alpha hydrolase family protein [Desulfurococcales archaeon]|nr:adenine nucleotide alpha hydrolase family protein [Desulfurococcales archaeon]